MAGGLTPCDEVNHSELHSVDWEAHNVHQEDLNHPADSSFHPDREETSRYQPLENAGCLFDKYSHQISNDRTPVSSTQSIHPIDPRGMDAGESSQKHQADESFQEQSPSSASNSATSSSIESLATVSSPTSPLTPTSTVSTDISKPVVRFTDRGPPRTSLKRPIISRRSSASAVPVVEWGMLFDENGYPTLRISQFLKGLAKHVIDNFAPGSSGLAITPEKLCVLYSKYRLDLEIYPFVEIFNSTVKDAYDRIADFFYDLECQYHLVPLNSHSRPRVPALTPVGFVQYITTCILAHPDEEFRRLDKIVTDVQLVADTSVAADGHPEKLPRQLLRSQFPVTYDPRSRKVLAAALEDLREDLGLFRLSGPKAPSAIMPPPSPGERDSIAGVRRYAPPGKLYVRRDGYILPASSESKARARYLPSAPLPQTTRDGNVIASGSKDVQNRDYYRHYGRAQTPYEENRDSHDTTPAATGPKSRHSQDDYTTPPGSPLIARHYTTSPRTSQTIPLTPSTSPRSTTTTPRSSSTTIYIPANTGPNATVKASGTSVAPNRRARSPPLQTYRASTLDVRSAPPTPGVGHREFKFSGYLPPAEVGPQSGKSSASAGGGGSGSSKQQIAASTPTTRSSTPTPTTSAAALVLPSSFSSSPSLSTSTSHQQRSPAHSRRDSFGSITGGSRRVVIASPTSSSTPALSSTEKKHQYHHHTHRQRRGAVGAVEEEKEEEDREDRGPTWEEALKTHHHHHSSGKGGGGGGHHYRHHSSH
ncbi:hypothetical protein F5Y04DRAFT_291109 [Hypomontagnella monticulosa]|nr:hypothetical protein F5Y04DRAFT_291109 [Hypomontagnella monticulosa]